MSTTPTSLSFGSMYFAPNVSEPATLTQTEFFDTVRRCLGDIEGVSDIHIGLDPTFRQRPDQSIEILPGGGDPNEFYVGPHWSFASVTFRLKITLTSQRKLDPISRRGAGSDSFRVHLGYGWQVPVSCVETVNDKAEDPTAGARLVFHYLQQEVERSAEQLTLACIPPIFTHADFFLFPTETSSGKDSFWLRSHTRPAYHRYEYYYNPNTVGDPAEEFFFALHPEVDLYYSSNAVTRTELMEWVVISDSVDNITSASKKRHDKTVLGSLHRGRQIRTTAISLTKFAAERQLTSSQLERGRRSTYSEGACYFARELVEDELDDRPDYPIERFSQLVQMLEAGRVVELQIVVALIASLIGAVIGASATLLAAG